MGSWDKSEKNSKDSRNENKMKNTDKQSTVKVESEKPTQKSCTHFLSKSMPVSEQLSPSKQTVRTDKEFINEYRKQNPVIVSKTMGENLKSQQKSVDNTLKSAPKTSNLNMPSLSVYVPKGFGNQSFIDQNISQDLRVKAEKYLGELELSQIKLGQLIGLGGFGFIVEGFYMDIGKVAVKICSTENNKFLRDGMAIAREFKHDNIIGIMYTLEKSDVMFIVMPFADTDLIHLMDSGGAFSQFDARHMCRQVLLGLQYIHNKGYAHRDIKLENILYFTNQRKYKICDLDSVTLNSNVNFANLTRYFGTPEYLPPEMISVKQVSDLRTHDVWSFGILAHSSVTFTYAFGNIVYGHQNLSKKIERMEKQVIKYPPGCHTHPVFEAFIKECLVFDQTQRPTVDALLQNPWFAITIPETHDRFRPCRIHHGIDRFTAVSTASNPDDSNCCCPIQ